MSFGKLLGIHNHAFVEMREDPRTGRGLYTKRDQLAGDTVLTGVRPIVSGANYTECIGKILLQKTDEEIKGVASTMMSVTQVKHDLRFFVLPILSRHQPSSCYSLSYRR